LLTAGWVNLRAGAVRILQQLASCCHLLRQLPKAAAASYAAAGFGQLVACIQQLLGLLKDVWCALRLLGDADGQAAQTSVAAAAAAAAECGCSLLAGLVAVSGADDDTAEDADALKGELAGAKHSRLKDTTAGMGECMCPACST
jgi:hypothetical protein